MFALHSFVVETQDTLVEDYSTFIHPNQSCWDDGHTCDLEVFNP